MSKQEKEAGFWLAGGVERGVFWGTRPMDNTQKPQRKIVQTQIVQETFNTHCTVVALADDGTIWLLPLGRAKQWEKMPTIPQPENETA